MRVHAGIVRAAVRQGPCAARLFVHVPGDRRFLRRDLRRRQLLRQRRELRRCEVAVEHHAVADFHAGGIRIRIRARRLDAVEQAGIERRELQLHDRAAGAAGADRVLDLAVALDDVLLAHHHRLRRDDVIGVELLIGVRADRDEIAACEGVVDLPGAVRRELLVRRTAAAAERPQELAVPGSQSAVRGRTARIEEHRHIVDRAIHHAALDAHDILHFDALIVRRLGEIRGRRGVRVIRFEARRAAATLRALLGRAIEKTILARDVALGVDGRGAQVARVSRRRRVRRRLRSRSCTDPRLHLLPGEDRTADRVIRDREPRAGTAVARSDDVVAVLQTAEQSDDTTIGALFERAADIATVHVDAQTLERGTCRQHDFDERIAAADQVGPVRQHLDFHARAET